MDLLKAVNTVLPHLGEHVITRIEGAKHPTVDLILAAIDRQRTRILSEGLWFNELVMTIPVSTDGQIEVPKDTLAVHGINCSVELDGEKFFNLATGSRYFTHPITVKIIRDVEFHKLPVPVAHCVLYRAGAEVYLQDYGRENTVTELQEEAERAWYQVRQDELRKRRYNSQYRTRQRLNNKVRFR